MTPDARPVPALGSGLLTDAQDAHHGDIQGDDVIAAKRAAA
jgi:hypothetical protein